jgi:hypothetical protein
MSANHPVAMHPSSAQQVLLLAPVAVLYRQKALSQCATAQQFGAQAQSC